MALAALVAFLLGSLLAFFTIGKILGLERASEVQLGEVSRARLELRRFSHRLVAVQEQERRRMGLAEVGHHARTVNSGDDDCFLVRSGVDGQDHSCLIIYRREELADISGQTSRRDRGWPRTRHR